MESRLERTVFLFTLILMLGAFAAGQFAGSADITGFASSTDAWNYEGAETAGDYLEVTFDSLGDGAVDFIVSFIAIMAAFTLAGSTLMKAGGAFGESTEAKAAINLFGVAAALGGSIYYAEAVTTYVLVFIPLILVTVFYKFLKGLKDGEEAGYWNFVFGGMSLIVLGYFVVNSSKIGLDWAGYLSIFIGALVFIYGLM